MVSISKRPTRCFGPTHGNPPTLDYAVETPEELEVAAILGCVNRALMEVMYDRASTAPAVSNPRSANNPDSPHVSGRLNIPNPNICNPQANTRNANSVLAQD